ncbi:MAG: diphosphate--fructose-6-phosphate 1-phosphotransferase [Pirellulales bacterium]
MSSPKNLIVAQSGGPSPVINNTLRGIIEMARDMDTIGTVYGAHHGIEGVLKEELIDLTAQPEEEISLLRYTPGAGSIGTCRYKLKDWQNEDFDRCMEIFKAHNIGYFIYIGGNDSMDTANKVALMAQERGLDMVGIGGPKTIDNDVGDNEFKLIDHTPGYASTAKYWQHMVQYANEENRGSCPADPVLVMQAMGRKIGYIPAAARLADPKREMPLQIYLAESPCSLEQLHENVNAQLKQAGRCIVVISEGFDVGDIGAAKDSFGHTSFSASQLTVAQIVTNYLNDKGLSAKGNARCNVSGTDQRHSMGYASSVDLDEAYHAGQMAAKLAGNHESGYMATILRNEGDIYSVRYDKAPLAEVANSERTFPANWITESGYDVTDGFVDYLKPLLGEGMVTLPMIDGRHRMTQLQSLYAEQKLPAYIPQADRQEAPK